MSYTVNGITRKAVRIKPQTDIQFGFWSWRQLPFFMVWKVWYDRRAEVEYAQVLFNSMNWIGF